MPRKNNPKAVREANRATWLALMAEFSAVPVTDDYDPSSLPHRITLKGQTLICRFDDGAEDDLPSVFSRWEGPSMEPIKQAGLPYHNPFSGKWNHHETLGSDCIASFAEGLRPHKPANYAHQTIGGFTLEQSLSGHITVRMAAKPWREVSLDLDQSKVLGLTPTTEQLEQLFTS